MSILTNSQKTRLSRFLPLPLGSAKARKEFAEKVLFDRPYEHLRKVDIPDPDMNHTRGGSGNNRNARMINALLAAMLFDDEKALEQSFIWGAHFSDQLRYGRGGWDNGHVQDHPNLFLLSDLAEGSLHAKLERGAFEVYRRIAGSQYLLPVPDGKDPWSYWQIGIGGTRPFTRALGAALRVSYIAEKYSKMWNHGPWTYDKSVPVPGVLRQRAIERWNMVYAWVVTNNEKRFWTGTPGSWNPRRGVHNWPFLPNPNPASINRHVRWFHLGIIWPFEIVSNISHGYDSPLQRKRAKELSAWAMDIGYHIGFGQHLRGNPFRPDAEHLQQSMRLRQTLQREGSWDGEPEYSIVPAVFLAGTRRGTKKVLRSWSAETRSIRAGEVAFDTCLGIYLMLKEWR